MGQLAMALASTHFDEILRLVNTNRRVATAWHRMRGPDLLRRFAALPDEDDPLLPVESGGKPLTSHLQRMLALLARYGSPPLQADIQAYGSLVLILPGLNLSDLQGWQP